MSQAMERALVAELIVTSAQGRRRGSGYRVSRDAVLTAAHVLDGAVSVEVRFEPDLPGQWVTTAVSWWADARSDVALLLISPRTDGETDPPVAEFGRLGDAPAVLDVQAVGFPRWKLRVDAEATDGELGRYRDACHAVGSVATLSNWREGTLEVALAFSPTPELNSSPWEGMSGAALWAGNRIVGVISKHHPGDGPSTLAAVRLDRALEVADPPVREALRNLLGLPEQAVQLPCVVPAMTGHEAIELVEGCPYPTDMAAFRPEQAEWFFGREGLTSQLVARLDHSLLHGSGPLIVVAPSGAGKSSLLQAGLVPKLGEAVLPGSRSWPRLLLTPTNQPMTSITTSLAALVSDEPTTVAAQLTDDPDRFVERLQRLLHARKETAEATRPRLMLIVDQLEELFTLCADKRERERFLDLLSRLTETTPSGHEPVALIVYGLRADFYARCADHPQLRAALQDNQLVVGPMSRDELRDAICKPAEHAGLAIETNLVEVMLRDLGANPRTQTDSAGGYEAGRLPLLAHALRATWRERHGNTLTLAGYQTTGGIQKAVEITADGVYATLDEREQQTARTVFLRLVRLGGDDAEDTRRRVPRAELLRDTTDAHSSHKVLDAFTQARLLTQYQDTVEITHEALLRAWPTLRRWIDTGRSAHLLRQDLDEAAQVWDRHGRGKADLFRGARLSNARDGINETDLSPLSVDFLAASTQHECEVAVSRRRRMLAGWGAAVLVAVLAVVLGIQLGIAQDERENAHFHQITARADQIRSENPSLAARFDLAAHEKRPGDPDVNTNLLGTQHIPLASPLPDVGDVNSVELSADGNTLATTGGTSGVCLWDVSNPAHPTPRGQALPSSEGNVELSADGKILATSSTGNTSGISTRITEVRLWEVSNPTEPPSRRGRIPVDQWVNSVELSLSADGNTLAVNSISSPGSIGSGASSEVRLWDVSKPTHPTPRGDAFPDGLGVGSVALSADGRTLATATSTITDITGIDGGDVEVRLWDVSDPAHLTFRRHPLPMGQGVVSMALSADGDTLATKSGSSGVRLWDVSDPARMSPPGNPLPDSEGTGSMALSADGNILATATSPGSSGSGGVRLWEIPDRLQSGDINSVALSADGHTLVTTSPGSSGSGGVRLWDVPNSTRPPLSRRGLVPARDGANAVALSGDGNILAISSGGAATEEVRLLDVSSPAHPFPRGNPVPVPDDRGAHAVALSGDGNILVTARSFPGNGSDEVQLWDVSDPLDPTPRGEPLLSGSGANAVALSGDGSILATSSSAGTEEVRLWDVSDPLDPTPRGEPLLSGSGANAVALSGDGNILVTARSFPGNGSDEVQLWDVSNPAHSTRRGDPLPGTQGVTSLALSTDGSTLVTDGDELRIWNQQQAIERACAATKNNLGRDEWNQYLPNQPFDPQRCEE